jgi:hypothetical protein
MLPKDYERTGFSHADVERFPGARFLLYCGRAKPNTSTPFCGDWGSRPNPSCGAVCCRGVYGDMAQSCWAWRLYGCSHARGRSEACASWGPNMSSGLPRAWDSVLTPSSLSSWVHCTNRVTIDSVGYVRNAWKSGLIYDVRRSEGPSTYLWRYSPPWDWRLTAVEESFSRGMSSVSLACKRGLCDRVSARF